MTQPFKLSLYNFLLILIVIIAAILRFWNLGEFQQLVFDEVYFPKNAHGYLTNTYFFDVHPPLSKYLIAIGIWLHNHMPWVTDAAYDTVDLEALSAVSWRWLNAATGTLLCFIAARFSLALYPNKTLSLLIALFVATDGTFIVESRFGLNNIYLVFFGLCAFLYIAKSIVSKNNTRYLLALCGFFLSLSYSIKWNGLGYSLAIWMLVFTPLILFYIRKIQFFKNYIPHQVGNNNWHNRIKLWEFPIYLIVLPLLVHFILWQPHLALFDQYSFVEMQKQILGYHSNTVNQNDHPYCSRWYSWPILLRPISYLFEADRSLPNPEDHLFTDVHLIGNPILFWLSSAAILDLFAIWLINIEEWIKTKKINDGFIFQSFVLAGFTANWFPWMIVSRCLFQYHYMAASFFTFMALAWFIVQWLQSPLKTLKALSVLILVAVMFGFVYWLPLQIGIPLSPDAYYDRIWLKSWI